MAAISYRTYLQNAADASNPDAQALLQVAGDDGVLDTGNPLSLSLLGVNDAYYSNYQKESVLPGFPQVLAATNDDDTTTNYNTTTGTGEATPDYSAEYSYLDTQDALNNQTIADANSTLGTGNTQIGNWYDQQLGDANTAQEGSLSDYLLQEGQTKDDRTSAVAGISADSRNAANSIQRIIGRAGGTQSSAFRDDTPWAVGREASAQRAGVYGDYGRNLLGIDQARDDTTANFLKLKENLGQEQTRRESELAGGVYDTQRGAYQSLANDAGERAELQGGNYDAIQAAQAPHLAKYNALGEKLLNLPSRYNQPFDVGAVNPTRADITPYTVDRQSIQRRKQAGNSGASPYEYLLKKKNEENL